MSPVADRQNWLRYQHPYLDGHRFEYLGPDCVFGVISGELRRETDPFTLRAIQTVVEGRNSSAWLWETLRAERRRQELRRMVS